MKSSEYRKILDKKKTELEVLKQQRIEKEEDVKQMKLYLEKLTKAKWLLSEAHKRTQNNFKGYVQNLVTLAINSVFQDRVFKFLVDFEIKRGKPECLLRVQEGDSEPYFPKDEMGGSIVDIICFALRIVLKSLEVNKTRKVVMLDEPFKHTGELSSLAGEMLKKVSKKLGLQILMITHDSKLAQISDKIFNVSHNGVHSVIKE